VSSDDRMHNDLPIEPQEAAKILLATLPAKRMRDVVEQRYGLKGRRRTTLEAIGARYKITRERVRQIERDAMGRLRREEHATVVPFFVLAEKTLRDHGGMMAAHHILSSLSPQRAHPSLHFLLQSSPRFIYIPEDDSFHARWASDSAAAEGARVAVHAAVQRLEREQKTFTDAEMHTVLSPDARVAEAYLSAAKSIRKNPYGQYGLVSWAAICPRGIKDKAYAALAVARKPLHFRDVAVAIDRAGWPGKRKAHPQTVHNELIKDSRFILVGRGMYALKEWGYEPGTVSDVLVSVLKESSRPLARDELIALAGERRMVKPQTILLNLQDKSRFRRADDGTYTLV